MRCEGLDFPLQDASGFIIWRLAAEQRALPAGNLKFLAAIAVNATACERVHIMERPKNWDSDGKLGKKILVVDEIADPVEMNNIRSYCTLQHGLAEWAQI
jgi:hypothetical protein